MEKTPEYCVVQTSCADEAEAKRLAAGMVEKKLAACVQIESIQSMYRWQGKVEQEAEFRLSAKTTSARLAEIKAFIAAEHPYEMPELMVLPVVGGSEVYLAWVVEQSQR